MKIFIAGSTGRVASKLIQDLIKDGHSIIAGSRHPEKQEELAGVTPVKLDLHQGVGQIAELMQGAEVVYFTAGSRGADLLQTDAFGAVKVAQAAEKVGAKRFILLSSLFALEPQKWESNASLKGIMDYNIAKFFADNYVVNDTDLDYTILQPTALTEKPGTGKITIDSGQDGENPIEDVALTLAEVLKYPQTIHHVLKMRGGETPVDQALAEV